MTDNGADDHWNHWHRLCREEGGRRFLQATEAVLRHGLAHENTEEPSLWRVMKKAMQRGWARQVSDLHCVRTDDGRTRALLRAGLNGKFLDHLLDAVLPLTPYPRLLRDPLSLLG